MNVEKFIKEAPRQFKESQKEFFSNLNA